MNHNKWLADNVTIQSERLRTSSINYRMICINKAPHHIRSVNPHAYTPMIISIGPYHYIDEKLQTTEKIKLVYLRYFIARVKIELEKFVSTIKEMEEMIRCCYAETSLHSMSNDDFVTMILLDAILILELFHSYSTRSWKGDDLVLSNQWMFPLKMLDLVLLENQLPFIVLEKLYNRTFDFNSPSLIHVENVVKKEGTKEDNTGKKKDEEHSCSDAKPEQNDRVYKERKKGKLKSNSGVLLK